MKIEDSPRLNYRLLTADDSQLLFELDQDPEVMRYINGGTPTSMEDIHNVSIPRLEGYTNKTEGWGQWGVFIKDTGQFIGWILVRPMEFYTEQPEPDNLELGWRFAQVSWGKGYATEAAKNIMAALINKGGIKRLTAIALDDNKGSINIMAKLGMKYHKTEVHNTSLGDRDIVFYHLDVM